MGACQSVSKLIVRKAESIMQDHFGLSIPGQIIEAFTTPQSCRQPSDDYDDRGIESYLKCCLLKKEKDLWFWVMIYSLVFMAGILIGAIIVGKRIASKSFMAHMATSTTTNNNNNLEVVNVSGNADQAEEVSLAAVGRSSRSNHTENPYRTSMPYRNCRVDHGSRQ